MTGFVPPSVFQKLGKIATTGENNGRESSMPYIDACTHFHGASGAIVCLTRDRVDPLDPYCPHHPALDRNWHLSLSFRQPQDSWARDRLASPRILGQLGAIIPLAPFDEEIAAEFRAAFFDQDATRQLIHERAASDTGKELDVRHWRLFCDEGWMPISVESSTFDAEFDRCSMMRWRP